MDNVCHTLAGAAIGEAGLKQRSALGMATLLIGSNLPDIDAAVFATDTLAMSFRRGWTHGVLAAAVLPALLAGAMYGIARLMPRRHGDTEQTPHTVLSAPPRLRGLLVLAYVATWLHLFMDWLNSYGIRLLMPFSNQWFYGDALYIIDPILYVIFGAGIFLARRRSRRDLPLPRRPARLAIAMAVTYMLVMILSNWWARAEVRSGLQRAGRGDVRFMVTPVLGNPFRREVIVDMGDRYEKGVLLFDPLPHFRPLGYGVDVNADHPAARLAATTPRVQAFLQWSRFPFFVVDGTRVFINDYRYSGPTVRDGWATQAVEVQQVR